MLLPCDTARLRARRRWVGRIGGTREEDVLWWKGGMRTDGTRWHCELDEDSRIYPRG